ncbi:MAG: sulfatase-like hydrolase/transferase [bacterium]|nr:sulfatase-like hydrolase/transferase [bacterium]
MAQLTPSSPVAAQEKEPARPDVVLITIDTLRADALGFAGNAVVKTPVLDRLAAQGRVFTGAHAHNVVTLPSHANILTGLYPYQHGIRDNSGFKLGDSVPTLATVLRAAGYATGAFVAAYPLDAEFGLGRGFDVYDDKYPAGPDPTEFVLPERPGDEVIAAALEWWRGERGEPRFLWVHLFDPHAPYLPPEPFATRYRETPYLGEVAATDSFLRPLLEPFLEGGEPPAVIAMTADHGEALGDHGEMTHGLFAYEPTLAVPLVLWGPGVTPGRDAGPARHVDLFPTLLAAAGVEAPGDDARERYGRSLLGDSDAVPTTYFEALSANLNRGWAPLRGVIREGRKLIALPLPELYDLGQDRDEAHNLISDQRQQARALVGELPAESVWPPERGEISPGEAERLRSLGYLSGSAEARESYGLEDDPKRLVELDRMMHLVIDLYSRGEVEQALRTARQVVEKRPDMPMGRSLLAQTLLESGATAEALQVMRRAREQSVVTETMLRQLGLTLSQIGESAEALEVLRPLAAGEDLRSLNALGLALTEAGRHDEAEATLERVLALDPDNVKAHEQHSLVGLRRGRWAAARDRARRALALDDQLPLAWNNLGVALYQLADVDGALDAWGRAVELDPGLWDALYNLGTRAFEHGRGEVARSALEKFVAGAPRERYAADLRRARVLLSRLERAGA